MPIGRRSRPLPSHVDRHRQAGLLAERACGVATTGGVLYQARITGSESPERPIAEADFQLARENDHPLPARRRMPIDELLRRKLLQPNAGCGLEFAGAPDGLVASAPRCGIHHQHRYTIDTRPS